MSFDERMIFWEDAMAVNKMILQEGQYGLVKEAIYEYRKRADESSMIDVSWQGKERYTITYLDQVYLALMKSRDTKINEMFTEEELAALRKYVGKILRKIRMKVILQIPTFLPIIEVILSMRAGKPVRTRRIYTGDDCIMVYRGVQLARLSERKVKLFHIVEDPEDWESARFGIHIAEAEQDILLNEVVFDEVERVYFES